MTPPAPPFQLVIFDMDGTLIEQMLDFQAIRRHLGIAQDEGILEALQAMSSDHRRDAEEWLIRTEREATARANLMPGAIETLAKIRTANIKTALLTRNTRASMQTVIEKFDLQFDLAWSREDGPIKPEPDSILKACSLLGADPKRTACVGDFEYDIQAANAAGALSILITSDLRQRPQFADTADQIITKLSQLPTLLEI
ncbi:MAG: HAD family hydrolase [Phycisphaerae bacterium]|jgi:HAD superfamily hydrolase (TIGR01509 family)|nr:HAD family hydrolase [Phycisphaerae bacterium]MDP7288549.1 HAD family hydrolase [Phycisphaerae bacterium]